MSETRPRLRTVGAAIAALLVILVVLSPMLLFGNSPTAFDLLLVAAGLLGVALLLRRGGAADARTLGTILVILGVVVLAFDVGLIAVLFASLGP